MCPTQTRDEGTLASRGKMTACGAGRRMQSRYPSTWTLAPCRRHLCMAASLPAGHSLQVCLSKRVIFTLYFLMVLLKDNTGPIKTCLSDAGNLMSNMERVLLCRE